MAERPADRFVASALPDGRTDAAALDVAEELERGRHERWAAIVLLLVGLVAIVGLIVVGPATTAARLWGATAVIGVGIGLAVAVVQEWRAGRAGRGLAAERAQLRALSGQLAALEAAAEACRHLAEAEELDEVLTRTLAGVRGVASARTAVVLLRTGDELNVVAAGGADPPTRGTRIAESDGPAWSAVRTGQTVQLAGGGPRGRSTGTATLAAPMSLPGQVIGALVAERGRSQLAFTGSDRASLELLAAHAALAVRAALRLERQRRTEAGRGGRSSAGAEQPTVAAAPAHDDLAPLVDIVHDLRTPLATVSGYVQLLIEREDRFTTTRRQAVLRDVRGEVDRLKDLVDGVLQVARSASDEHRVEQLVDLAEVAREVQAAGRDLPHAQRLPRTVRVRATTPAIVVGDLAALRRVVENVVDDALSRELTGCPLDVTVERTEGWVELTVGPPATVEERAVEDGGTVEPGGTALPTGLQVARMLVERHGGSLELGADGGAWSRVRLPAI
jgi:K+-sensing histidine kinase KdpD